MYFAVGRDHLYVADMKRNGKNSFLSGPAERAFGHYSVNWGRTIPNHGILFVVMVMRCHICDDPYAIAKLGPNSIRYSYVEIQKASVMSCSRCLHYAFRTNDEPFYKFRRDYHGATSRNY